MYGCKICSAEWNVPAANNTCPREFRPLTGRGFLSLTLCVEAAQDWQDRVLMLRFRAMILLIRERAADMPGLVVLAKPCHIQIGAEP